MRTQKQAMGYGSQAREARRIAVERAVAAAVARCVAVCRGVEAACAPDSTEHVTARAIREAIERGAVGR